jgi:GNAT superfamily N-acetyltransferase
MDESLDHRLPILGCLIVRIMPVRKPECDFDSTPDVDRGKPRAILHFMALAVDPEYRRLGIAETLVGTAIGKAGEVAASKGGWGLPFNTTTTSPSTSSLSSSQSTISSSSASSASHSPTGYFDNMYNYHHHHHHHHDKQSQSQHHQSHDTISVTIALKAEGIIKRSRTTGEKDEGSMLFWQRMGLTTRVVRLRGRKGWEGDNVRDVQVPIYRL